MTTLMLACVLISVAVAAVAGDRWRRLTRPGIRVRDLPPQHAAAWQTA